ncbi:hypothetical protein [Nocardioides gansuensis]|uniref:hypothetical protein n=1 Tax=Nocardioides gansuensis TaxID=2138300 RepID=UPI001401F481|nr:hypothetical protein [Nocardioides gansuensis]
MTETLVAALGAILILAGLLTLVRFVRRDTFAGPSLRHQPHDELGYRYSPLIGKPS